jgi:hypothetical protein
VKDIPNFTIEIEGKKGEVFVSDSDQGKYMCVFVNNGVTDFTTIYNAYGFMVWTATDMHTATEFFPIKLQADTRLTVEVIHAMWMGISKQITELLL